VTIAQLVHELQQLDQGKEILAKFSGTWYEVNLTFAPCANWPEYFVQVEALSPKTHEGY